MLKKRVVERNGRKFYLIGIRKETGDLYWLEENHWDCGWYWGTGYIYSFTSNNPETARDLKEFFHWDSTFMNKIGKCSWDVFKDFFSESVFNEKELWTFCECMNTMLTLRKTADLLYIGGSHITTNPIKDLLTENDKARAKDFNEILIPAQWEVIKDLMTPFN